MRILFCIILLMTLSACIRKEKRTVAHFESIEITYDNGWTGGLTVHIDSLGIIHKCKYRIISKIDSSICYVDTLNAKLIDTLNIKIDQIKTETIDSIYDGHCEDCGGFIVKIKYDNKTIRSMIIGSNKFDNTISNFSKYVMGFKIDKNIVDSCFIFETTKYLIPPQFDPAIKFTPPTNE
jgi:hypothetical protein